MNVIQKRTQKFCRILLNIGFKSRMMFLNGVSEMVRENTLSFAGPIHDKRCGERKSDFSMTPQGILFVQIYQKSMFLKFDLGVRGRNRRQFLIAGLLIIYNIEKVIHERIAVKETLQDTIEETSIPQIHHTHRPWCHRRTQQSAAAVQIRIGRMIQHESLISAKISRSNGITIGGI